MSNLSYVDIVKIGRYFAFKQKPYSSDNLLGHFNVHRFVVRQADFDVSGFQSDLHPLPLVDFKGKLKVV